MLRPPISSASFNVAAVCSTRGRRTLASDLSGNRSLSSMTSREYTSGHAGAAALKNWADVCETSERELRSPLRGMLEMLPTSR